LKPVLQPGQVRPPSFPPSPRLQAHSHHGSCMRLIISFPPSFLLSLPPCLPPSFPGPLPPRLPSFRRVCNHASEAPLGQQRHTACK
jgi:hypothetical protein